MRDGARRPLDRSGRRRPPRKLRRYRSRPRRRGWLSHVTLQEAEAYVRMMIVHVFFDDGRRRSRWNRKAPLLAACEAVRDPTDWVVIRDVVRMALSYMWPHGNAPRWSCVVTSTPGHPQAPQARVGLRGCVTTRQPRSARRGIQQQAPAQRGTSRRRAGRAGLPAPGRPLAAEKTRQFPRSRLTTSSACRPVSVPLAGRPATGRTRPVFLIDLSFGVTTFPTAVDFAVAYQPRFATLEQRR